MVDTLVLEASALCVRVRVSLGAPNCDCGEIGRHKGFKIPRIMHPGSIPGSRTKDK